MARKKQEEPEPEAAEEAAVYAAENKAWEEYKRELIAEFQKYLREYNKKNNIEWISDEDEVWRYYQTLRLPLARADFGNAPLNDDGTLAISIELSEELRKAARAAVLDTAAANARYRQRSVTRRQTAHGDHADIRRALEDEVAKRGGKTARGDMKIIYSNVALSVTKARKKKERDGVEPRTVQRVWLEMKKQL